MGDEYKREDKVEKRRIEEPSRVGSSFVKYIFITIIVVAILVFLAVYVIPLLTGIGDGGGNGGGNGGTGIIIDGGGNGVEIPVEVS